MSPRYCKILTRAGLTRSSRTLHNVAFIRRTDFPAWTSVVPVPKEDMHGLRISLKISAEVTADYLVADPRRYSNIKKLHIII